MTVSPYIAAAVEACKLPINAMYVPEWGGMFGHHDEQWWFKDPYGIHKAWTSQNAAKQYVFLRTRLLNEARKD